MSEFSLIHRYFKPLTMNRAEAGALENDTAAFDIPAGKQLVISTDTLSEGVHFFADTPPDIIAQKALRSNLSDIISAGAAPFAYQLALALPRDMDGVQSWLADFTSALLADQKRADIFCSGGDTTSTLGGVSITITMFGLAEAGKHITRAGAKDGDHIIVTGALGQGALAYQQGKTIAPPMHDPALAEVIARYASAAVDISDGLLADLGHICTASGAGAELQAPAIVHQGELITAITGGDDYEIALTVPPESAHLCMQALQSCGASHAMIGQMRINVPTITLYDGDGAPIKLPKKSGWQHF